MDYRPHQNGREGEGFRGLCRNFYGVPRTVTPPPQVTTIGPECVKTLRQNWSVCVDVKSEIYRHVSRYGFRVEAWFSVRFWAPVALKNVFTQPRPEADAPHTDDICCRRFATSGG